MCSPARLLALLLLAGWTAQAQHEWDGSPVLPVHRIPLLDETGNTILPDADSAAPVSTRQSCIQCHDYEAIQSGWHFSDEGDLAGRPTEPWFLVDEKSGTYLPVSRRDGAAAWAPEHLGMSDWDFVKQFGRHMPGGGPGETERTQPDPDSRWTVSGNLEINCFACHNTGPHQDLTEWVKQISRENFRWASTAAACLGDVDGTASLLPGTWNPTDGPDPDDLVYRVPPGVRYHDGLFDSKNQALLDLGKPTDARCMQCHAVHQVGKPKHHHTGDIHTRAGMDCISCHSHGIDHKIDRGTSGTFSCAGCHGLEEPSTATVAGTYGAPIPEHKGLPPIHLEKMACTACHSGAAIDQGPVQVRTSRANRLGIHGRAQWMTEAPHIVEPVFLRGEDGKIAPHRMTWPAFWARRAGEELTPIAGEEVLAECGDILDPSLAVASVLSVLNKVTDADGNPIGQAVFVAGTTVYSANLDAGLDINPTIQAPADAPSFGFLVNGALQPIAAPYDANEENAFYYLDESHQELVISVLTSLADLAPEGSTPVWVVGKKQHRIQDVTYERVPAEELAQLRQQASEAKAAVEALATKLNVTAEVEGTRQKFYSKTDNVELKASRSKTPQLYELKVLMKIQRKAESKLSELEIIGAKAYRNTFQKNTSRYPVIEDLKQPGAITWGWLKDGQVLPLVPDYVGTFIRETVGHETVVFSEQQVAMALQVLGDDAVYVSGGKVHNRGEGGRLEASTHPRAEPVSWPLGHDVRPAAQSLGTKGCAECHSEDSPFLFADIVPTGPLQQDAASGTTMSSYMKLDKGYHALFGKSFTTRPAFKVILAVLAVIATLVVLAYAMAGIRALPQRSARPALAQLALVIGGLSTLILAYTGFVGGWGKTLGGYQLLVHVGVGGLFAVCLVVVALLRAPEHTCLCSLRSGAFWAMLLGGIAMILSILVAMVPLLGTHAQHTALLVHEIAAVCFILAAILYALSPRKADRA